MHTGNIQKSYVEINSWITIDPTSSTKVNTTEHVLPIFELISWERIDLLRPFNTRRKLLFASIHVGVDQLSMLLVLAKYNLSCQIIGFSVDGHTSKICQNLTSKKVGRLQIIEQCFGRNYVILAVFSDFVPIFLRYRFVPREFKLQMMNTKLNFPLLKALLSRRKVVNISVAQIISSTKFTALLLDDTLGKFVNILV